MKRYLTFFFLLIASLALCAYPEGAINNIDGSALGWDDTAKKWRPLAVDANGNIQSGGTTIDNISVDTSNIETYLKKTDGGNTVTITDLINGIGTDTSNIDSALNIDNVSVTQLVNGIGTDTSNIESSLKVDNVTVTELVNGIGTDTSNIINTLKFSAGGLNYSVIDRLIMIAADVGSLSKTAQPSNFKTARLSSIAASTATQVSPITSGSGSIRVFVELRAIDEDTEFFIGFDSSVTDSNGRPVKGRILLNMPSSQALYIYHTNSSAIDVQQTEGWR